MRIGVGSTNPVKVVAVKKLLLLYGMFYEAEVISVNVPSDVSAQPKSLGETIKGATNRAWGAFKENGLGIGIECGLMEVPETKTGMMDVCVCVICDGETYHVGLSSAFECPTSVIDLVRNEGLELNEAFYKAGLTTNPKLSSAEGAAGLLTRGQMTGIEFVQQAVISALVHLQNPTLYK